MYWCAHEKLDHAMWILRIMQPSMQHVMGKKILHHLSKAPIGNFLYSSCVCFLSNFVLVFILLLCTRAKILRKIEIQSLKLIRLLQRLPNRVKSCAGGFQRFSFVLKQIWEIWNELFCSFWSTEPAWRNQCSWPIYTSSESLIKENSCFFSCLSLLQCVEHKSS